MERSREIEVSRFVADIGQARKSFGPAQAEDPLFGLERMAEGCLAERPRVCQKLYSVKRPTRRGEFRRESLGGESSRVTPVSGS